MVKGLTLQLGWGQRGKKELLAPVCHVLQFFLQRGEFFAQGKIRDTAVSSTDGSPPGRIEMPEGAPQRLQARGELSDQVGHFRGRNFFIGLFELAAPGMRRQQADGHDDHLTNDKSS